MSFAEAHRKVAKIAESAPPAQPTVSLRDRLDRASLESHVAGAQERAAQERNRGLLCVAASLADAQANKGLRMAWDEQLRRLGWGVDDDANVVIPHYTSEGRLAGAKIRALDGRKWSFPGSEYRSLYGCWLKRTNERELLLVEGETDFAHAMWHVRQVADRPYILSVPSGVKQRPRDEWLAIARLFYDVYFAFDGDEHGRDGEAIWAGYLETTGRCPRLWHCAVRSGHDLRSNGASPRLLMDAAERLA